jgi:hypothetical protein
MSQLLNDMAIAYMPRNRVSSQILVKIQKPRSKPGFCILTPPGAAKIEAGNLSPGESTMSLLISDELVKASGFSENELEW